MTEVAVLCSPADSPPRSPMATSPFSLVCSGCAGEGGRRGERSEQGERGEQSESSERSEHCSTALPQAGLRRLRALSARATLAVFVRRASVSKGLRDGLVPQASKASSASKASGASAAAAGKGGAACGDVEEGLDLRQRSRT